MISKSQKTVARFKKTVVFVALIAILIGMRAPATQAQGVPISTLLDAFSIATNRKDFGLNQLAYIAAKQILHQMTVSTVNWINSGFKGSPAFLTNPKGFFLDAADQATGEFLGQNASDGQLKDLCSPWSVDLRIALSLDRIRPTSSRYYCTLGSIINSARNTSIQTGISMDGFINGDFSQGGWPAFIAMTSENNPYSDYFRAHSDLLQAVGEKQGAISQQLQQGNGFLSFESCKDYTYLGGTLGQDRPSDPSVSRKPGGGWEKCTTETPGSVISSTINKALGSPQEELVAAQDINAIISALVSQLMSQMLSKGLASLSSSGSGVSNGNGGTQSSLTAQIYRDATSPKTVPIGTTNNGGQTTNSIRTTYDQAINAITDSRNRYETARSCLVSNGSVAAQGAVSAIDFAVSTKVDPLLATLRANQASTTSQASNAEGAGGSTLVVPGTNDINQLSNGTLIQNQIDGYQNAVDSSINQSQNLSNLGSIAGSDLANAQAQAQIFNKDAAQYQSTCGTL